MKIKMHLKKVIFKYLLFIWYLDIYYLISLRKYENVIIDDKMIFFLKNIYFF